MSENTEDHIQNIQTYPRGNTSTLGNAQIYRWCFTLKESHIQNIQLWSTLSEFSKKFTYQLEIGEKGFRHYQGTFSLRHKETFRTVKNLLPNVAHIEPCKDWFASIAYCSKEDTRVGGPWSDDKKPLDLPMPKEEWAKQVIDIITAEPDKRKIYWFWESQGGIGKTKLCKHIWANYEGVVLLGGKRGDVLMKVARHGNCRIAIYDVPRCIGEWIDYGALEAVKNACVISGKYEGAEWISDINPHVIVFANQEPDYTKMSTDRWEVIDLNRKIDCVDGFEIP